MTTFNSVTVLGLCAVISSTAATAAQSPPDPAAASSPQQQRGATGSGTADQQGPMRADPSHHRIGADHDGADPAKFVTKAAQGGMTEVALSKAAASKSSNADVKKFAEQMVQDHQKANAELSAIAKNKGLSVPASLDPEHQAIVQKINNQTGEGFDQTYGKQMAMDHAKTVALFEAATQSTDPDLAAFARKTLPTLKEHKQMAGKLPGATHSAGIGEAAKASEGM
jgi:putative membrane protein